MTSFAAMPVGTVKLTQTPFEDSPCTDAAEGVTVAPDPHARICPMFVTATVGVVLIVAGVGINNLAFVVEVINPVPITRDALG